MPWQARLVRVTAFVGPAAQADDIPKWATLIGSPAEAKTIRLGLTHEEGSFRRGRLAVVAQAGVRADIVYAAAIDPQIGALQMLGGLSEAFSDVVPIANRFLEECPETSRVALGAILLEPTNSLQSAHEFLNTRVKSTRFNFDGASDFLYQINRPRPSKTLGNLSINRLSKWAAVRMTLVQQDPSAGTTVPLTETNAASLELDLSTDSSWHGALSVSQRFSLFTELLALGAELSESGDIP